MEVDSDQMDLPKGHYESLHVSPDDFLETTKKAYEGLVDFISLGQGEQHENYRCPDNRVLHGAGGIHFPPADLSTAARKKRGPVI